MELWIGRDKFSKELGEVVQGQPTIAMSGNPRFPLKSAILRNRHSYPDSFSYPKRIWVGYDTYFSTSLLALTNPKLPTFSWLATCH